MDRPDTFGRRAQLSREVPVVTYHLAICAIVPVDYMASKQPVPYFLSFIPPFRKVTKPSCQIIRFPIRLGWLINDLVVESCEKFGPMCLLSVQELLCHEIFEILMIGLQL